MGTCRDIYEIILERKEKRNDGSLIHSVSPAKVWKVWVQIYRRDRRAKVRRGLSSLPLQRRYVTVHTRPGVERAKIIYWFWMGGHHGGLGWPAGCGDWGCVWPSAPAVRQLYHALLPLAWNTCNQPPISQTWGPTPPHIILRSATAYE